MTILKKLWQTFKGEEQPKAAPWIVQQAKWDPARKLFVVGNLPETDVIEPRNLTVDSRPLPSGWHQCFYYYEDKNEVTGSFSWRRCRSLAGPGYKPSFCLLHTEEMLASHKATEKVKQQPMDNGRKYYCKHGPCIITIGKDEQYCKDHKSLYDNTGLKSLLSEDECGCYGYCENHFNKGVPRTQEQIEWDAITEDVDWDYCSKIGWGELRYRRNRKSIPVQAQENVHFKLELRGQRDSVDLFHAMLHLCDSDYPLDPFRKNTATPERCNNCGGYVWKNAIVTPVDIKKAARQAGITVKVRHYFPETTCKKKDRAASA